MKVLHLPTATGGNAAGLAQGEKLLGYDSQVLTITRTKYNYPSDIDLNISGKNVLQHFWRRSLAFLKYRKGFDVYHFNFGSTLLHAPQFFLNLFDLPFYDSSAKKVMTFQGCDARQKYPTMARHRSCHSTAAACFEKECYGGVCNSGKRDTHRRKAIEKADRYISHFFVLNADLFHFLPREKSTFLPYSVANLENIMPKENFFTNDKIHIVHAPTQRITKGTSYVLSAIQELQSEYPNAIEFTLVENLPQLEALQRYRKADLFIDQLLIGGYGGVAVEVMQMGIPVAASFNESDFQFLPADYVADIPCIKVSIFNLKEKLKNIILHREQLIELGKQAKLFAKKWHDPVVVAKMVTRFY